ncbi:gliding motility-associated ABC transporter substrate-binding protein GldG [Rapidithrix thailandica]|uniref:Gliding motility-associated ABC transporter substrate-binding protein GldG n=1 Tax=Rapidithrix thailandica TaxID=413964 RepID=A0AAW9RZ17_9BACT
MKLNNPKKWEDILQYTALVLLLVLINIHSGQWFFRWDLTDEKRYTISGASKELLSGLNDVVYVEVYLDGDLNSEFRRLQKAIRETLEEFKIFGGKNLEFKFTDPNEAPTAQARNRFYQQLVQKGLPYTNVFDVVEGERKEQILFPGAIITYKNREKPVLLLKGNKAASEQEQLNQSVEGIEFELASAIGQLVATQKKSIAFIEGHDELNQVQTADITTSLSEGYIVDRVRLEQTDLSRYDALIIAQPKKKFSELDKFKLDQYVMRGGNVLFFMDKVQMNLDSISQGGTYAFGYDLNIEPLLFRYGVRVNIDLLKDQQAGAVEVVTGTFGNRPRTQTLPWVYYIYLNKFSEHPIVRNMDVIYGKFLSTIDTVKAEGVTKTPLVYTSKYTQVKGIPSMIDLNEIREDANRDLYNRQHLPVAYLLEGKFKSLYANRFPPKGAEGTEIVKQGNQAKILVFSDGDILRNEINPRNNNVQPIDFDPFRQQSLSNKEFILNTLSYMTDKGGLIASRNKSITLRPLDMPRVREEKIYWQILNVALPVALIIVFGIGRYYLRKRKYERKA